MRFMEQDRMSRKYHLLWNENQRAIIVQVHAECVQSGESLFVRSPLVRAFSEMHGADGLFDSFRGDLKGGDFGFNGSMRKIGENGDYVEFSVPIPQVKKETNIVCEECGGSGKRDRSDPCFHCEGRGKKHLYDWRTAYLTASSLAVLFDGLELCEETQSEDCQHVIIHMMAEYGQHGSSLGGCFGIDCCEFLRRGSTAKDITLGNVVEAMRTAYGQLMICRDYDRFRVNAERGYLTMDCPGDACGIHLSHHDRSVGYGCEFSCHNVDNPAQSLTLIAGIASLVGQADRFISAKKKDPMAA